MIAPIIACRKLVGREVDLAHLLERRRRASRADGGIVTIAGDAGIGKSRLVAEFRTALRGMRVRVAVAHCRQFAEQPYAPLLDLLRQLGSSHAPLEAASSRDELFGRIVEAFVTVGQNRCVVAIVEDVHWADRATIELLAALGRAAASERVLVVATYRTDALTQAPALHAAIARLGSADYASRINLRALEAGDVRALIDGALGAIPLSADVRATVASLCEGNPFFTEELLKSALERCEGPGEPALPATISAAVMERLAPLSGDDYDVLAQAAVVGRRFTIAALEATLTLAPDRIRHALRLARDLRVIAEDDGDELRFRHALTRETILEGFLTAQRIELHRRVAVYLEGLPDAARSVQGLAYHWWAANDATKAAHYGALAGDESMRVFAYEEAVRFFRYAAQFTERASPLGADLRAKIGHAYALCGERSQGLRFMTEAADLHQLLGDLEREAECRITCAAFSYDLRIAEAAQPLSDIGQRLEKAGLAAALRRVELTRAEILSAQGAFADAREILERLKEPPASSPLLERMPYFAARARLLAQEADIDGYIANAKTVLDMIGDELAWLRAIVLNNATNVTIELGYLAHARVFLGEAEQLATDHKLRVQMAFALGYRARIQYLSGNLSAAKATVAQGLAIATDHRNARLGIVAQGTLIALLRGDDELLALCSDGDLVSGDEVPVMVAFARTERLRSAGRPDEARRALRAVFDRESHRSVPFEIPLAVARFGSMRDVDVVWCALEGRAGAGRDLALDAMRYLFEAIVLERRADARAPARAIEAADAFAAIGYPLWRADALRVAGRAQEAVAVYRSIGAVARLRDVAGSGLLDPAPVPSAATVTGTLTPREREVAKRVRAGASNAEIAAALGVSVKGVEKHLGAIYRKLNIVSRAKLIVHLKGATPEGQGAVPGG